MHRARFRPRRVREVRLRRLEGGQPASRSREIAERRDKHRLTRQRGKSAGRPQSALSADGRRIRDPSQPRHPIRPATPGPARPRAAPDRRRHVGPAIGCAAARAHAWASRSSTQLTTARGTRKIVGFHRIKWERGISIENKASTSPAWRGRRCGLETQPCLPERAVLSLESSGVEPCTRRLPKRTR